MNGESQNAGSPGEKIIKPNIVFPLVPYHREIFKRAQRLNTVSDVGRLMTKIINLVLMGQIDEVQAGRVIQMLSTLSKTIQVSDFELRLEELEKKIYGEPENEA